MSKVIILIKFKKVHEKFPDKQLIFTEGCQEGGPHIGSWKLGERYANSIINDLNRWTVGWLDWNLILDESGGPNHVGNLCSAPIIVKNNDIILQSSYYYIGHFSRFIQSGDFIIESKVLSNNLKSLSAIDKKGNVKTIVLNDKNMEFKLKIILDDNKYALRIPSRSIITLIFK